LERQSSDDIIEACCWYDKQKSSIDVLTEPSEDDMRYIRSLKRNYIKLYESPAVDHPNVKYVSIDLCNINTVQSFKSICEFLEFDMEKFPVIIPIKVKKDWQVYAGYNTTGLNERLQMIKDAIRRKKNDQSKSDLSHAG